MDTLYVKHWDLEIHYKAIDLKFRVTTVTVPLTSKVKFTTDPHVVWPEPQPESRATKGRTAARDRLRTDSDHRLQLPFKHKYKGSWASSNGYDVVNSDIELRLHLDINKHLLLRI